MTERPVASPGGADRGRSRALDPARAHVLDPARAHVLDPARAHVLDPARAHVLDPARAHVLDPGHAPGQALGGGRFFTTRLVTRITCLVTLLALTPWVLPWTWTRTPWAAAAFAFLGATAVLVLAWLETRGLYASLPALHQTVETMERREEELVRLNTDLEVASGLKTRFLANVSHELRTPLAAVVACANLLGDEVQGPLVPQQKVLVQKVLKHADHLLYLINDLLDIARIEAGKLQMTMGRVSLEECLESAWASVEPQARDRDLAFQVDVPEETIEVSGNFHRLQQVFVNLLGNAVKFTPRGEIGVWARTVGAMAEVRIWDSGIGIAQESLPHIFDEFRQGDDSVRRRFGGSGLGLAICRKLVELHGGTIAAEPRTPEGTTIVVRLPVVETPPPR